MPNRLFVAVAGHPYGPNPERGIYRSTDGGQSFEKVLYKDENIGAGDVKIDPSDPNIVYATLWEAREGPWENGELNGTGGGIFKSTDGGQTWHPLAGGLPDGIVQAYVAIARSDPKRLFASVATKDKVDLYRSDDGGETWTIATTDPRPREPYRRRRFACADHRSEESRCGLHDQHRHLEIQPMEARPGLAFAALPAATTTRTSGSIPTIPTRSS